MPNSSSYLYTSIIKRISQYNNIPSDVGYSVAGVQYRYACFCASSYAHAERRREERCNMRCPGDCSQMCGGSYLMNVYDRYLGQFQ